MKTAALFRTLEALKIFAVIFLFQISFSTPVFADFSCGKISITSGLSDQSVLQRHSDYKAHFQIDGFVNPAKNTLSSLITL